MKKLILIIPIFALLSCTVQKRKYQKGYYLSWKHKQNTEKANAAKSEISDSCDVVIMQNGKQVYVKVLEINYDEVWYKKCNSSNGKRHKFEKEKLSVLKYADGSQVVFDSPPSYEAEQMQHHREHLQKQRHPDVLKSILWGFTGLIWLGSLKAVFLGLDTLSDMKNSSSRNYKGKWLAIFGIVLGVIGIIFWLVKAIAIVTTTLILFIL